VCQRPEFWRTGCLPPLPELVVVGELAQSVSEGRVDVGLDEIGLLLAARCFAAIAGTNRRSRPASVLDRRRAVEAALWLEGHFQQSIELARIAKKVELSSFHFLRVFAGVFGVTPHQYLLRCRLRQAAKLLADPSRSITEIAYAVGFSDLSNFVRTFRRAAGVSPRRFRTGHSANLKLMA
jgi:AraC family transcriptional regulator